jgi:phage terminase large subunit-like protein
VLENPWIPDTIKTGLTPRQAEFLCYEGREALYGGAAGGGKSVALLVAALQYIDQPGYTALLLRRTYKQLAKSDSILSKAKEWLLPLKSKGVRYNGDEYKFTFPGGQTLEFGHMDTENAKHNYQGGAWAFVGADEATQFTGPMLAYPRTRQRRPAGSPIPIRWRGGSNPGGVGHEYVKARYVKAADGTCPATPERQFFPATIDDNPNLDREDYVRQLLDAGVDVVTLEQLLKGNWDAVPGGRFLRDYFLHRWTRRGDYLNLQRPGENQVRTPVIWDLRRFMTVDPAASAKNTSDWTVAGHWGATRQNELILLDAVRFQARVPEIVPRLLAVWQQWRKPQGVWIEAVAANNAVYELARDTPMPARRLDPLGQDKLVRATPAINLAASARIWLPVSGSVPGMPLDEIEAELYRFTGDDKVDDHDDAVDMVSYAARVLAEDDEGRGGIAPKVYGGGY